MSLQRKNWNRLAVSTFLFALAVGPASAQSVDDVAARLKSTFSEQGIEIDWAGVSGDTSSMRLQGVKFKPAGVEDAMDIGDVTLEGVSEANGDYTINTVSTSAYSRSEGELSFEMSPFIMRDVVLFADGTNSPFGGMLYYRAANLDNLVVKSTGKTAFSASGIAIEMSEFDGGKPVSMSATVPAFTSDLTLVEDPRYKDAIEALGYQNINGSALMEGSWDPADGKMDISKYDMKVDDAGTFGITFSIGGYTVEFIKSVQELQKQMAAMPEDADNSAQGMAMLGLMQQLSFNGATIRFTDDSLTNKVLDYVGKQQGMSGKDVANQAKAIVPFGLAQLQNPDLAAQASAAVNQYFDDPRSLEILANPASPVPFAMIMADAMANPANLTRTLGVAVQANQN